MISQDQINSFYEALAKNDKEFIRAVKQFIKLGIRLSKNAPELNEILDEMDGVYQTHITDVNYHFYFKIKDREAEFHEGIHDSPDFSVWVTKELTVKMLSRELTGVDAYMKGIIKARGSLTQGFKYIKFYRNLTNYLMRQNDGLSEKRKETGKDE